MNAKYLITASAILAASGSALAGIEWVATGEDFVSTKTRAEVVAETKQASADGTLGTMARDGPASFELASSVPGKTRAEVVAERDQAIADGTLTTMSLEGVAPIQFASSRNRDEVRSEAMLANRSQYSH